MEKGRIIRAGQQQLKNSNVVTSFDDFESILFQDAAADMERTYKNRKCKILLLSCILGIILLVQLLDFRTYSTIYSNNEFDHSTDYVATSSNGAMKIGSGSSTTQQQQDNGYRKSSSHHHRANITTSLSTSNVADVEERIRTTITNYTTNTLGAVLHLGRTGGSIIARHFLSAFDNNDDTNNKSGRSSNTDAVTASSISQLATYYHHSEFDRLAACSSNSSSSSTINTNTLIGDFVTNPSSQHQQQSQSQQPQQKYQFLIVTVRDPLDRTVSSYAWMHPSNPNYTAGITQQHDVFYNKCFPNLDSFASALEIDNENTSEADEEGNTAQEEVNETDDHHTLRRHRRRRLQHQSNRRTVPNDRNRIRGGNDDFNCTQLAKSTLNNEIQELEYFYWDTKNVWNQLITSSDLVDEKADLFVIRLESMEDDWQSIHQILGVQQQQYHPSASLLSSSMDATESNITINADTNITGVTTSSSHVMDTLTSLHSTESRRRLCHALLPEYEAYLSILQRATNLLPPEQEKSLSIARTNCPYLHLQYPTNVLLR